MTRAEPPARLALQTGRLDDQRPQIAPGHPLWDSAHALFTEPDHLDAGEQAAKLEREEALCSAWPVAHSRAHGVEALAVAVALAAPFASEQRVLLALAASGRDPGELRRLLDDAPAVAHPPDTPRPRFAHIYDPDRAAPAPIVALLDGPRSPEVAQLLETMKAHDRNLADAIVLGADIEMLDLIERLGETARSAGRSGLADMFEHDRRLWCDRADAARGRLRLEGAHYHWHTDNVPPECIEAARADIQHNVDALLRLPPAAS